jgi:spermidine synthase
MIVKIIGGAPFAISIILTIFMGGLGLGSYLASRTIDRIKEPMRLVKIYGVLELIIGAYGLAVPVLLVVFRPIYAVVYNRLLFIIGFLATLCCITFLPLLAALYSYVSLLFVWGRRFLFYAGFMLPNCPT